MAKDIFKERGISDEVRDARPYVAYNSREDVLAADPLYGELTGHEKADLTRTMKAGPGWVMTRHPVPDYPEIFAELRPDRAVPQSPRVHHHRLGLTPPTQDKWAEHLLNDECWNDHVAAMEAGDCPGRHESKEEWASCPTRHRHEESKKYTFPMGEGRAARVDVHPLALRAIQEDRPSRVFYCLEGVLKADAILSAGEPAISVPSVTMWNGPRAEAIAILRDVPEVLVVSDSDHLHNPKVRLNSMLCAHDLRDAGINAHHAAPPELPGEAKLGVDDWLYRRGPGGLHELEQFELILPPGLPEFEERELRLAGSGLGSGKRRQAVSRNARVLRFLISHATVEGLVRVSSRTIGRYLRMDKSTAQEGLTALQLKGVIRRVAPPKRKKPPPWIKKGVVSEPTMYMIADQSLRGRWTVWPIGAP